MWLVLAQREKKVSQCLILMSAMFGLPTGLRISANIAIWSLTGIENISYRTLNSGWSPKTVMGQHGRHRGDSSASQCVVLAAVTYFCSGRNFQWLFSDQMCLQCAYIPLCQHATLLRRRMGNIEFPHHNEPTRRLNRKCSITARKPTRRNIDRKFSADVSN